MMLARHAENLFWAGRYVERAQDTARMLDATYHHSAGLAPEQAARAWANLLRSLGLDHEFAASGCELDVGTVTVFLMGDAGEAGCHRPVGPAGPGERPIGARAAVLGAVRGLQPVLPGAAGIPAPQPSRRRAGRGPGRDLRRGPPALPVDPRRGHRDHAPGRPVALPHARHAAGAGRDHEPDAVGAPGWPTPTTRSPTRSPRGPSCSSPAPPSRPSSAGSGGPPRA